LPMYHTPYKGTTPTFDWWIIITMMAQCQNARFPIRVAFLPDEMISFVSVEHHWHPIT
jgi:hypothetical protein